MLDTLTFGRESAAPVESVDRTVEAPMRRAQGGRHGIRIVEHIKR